MQPILRPGRNCWRLAQADRFSFLINGAPYFAALRDSLGRARRSIGILAWDLDSRLELVPEVTDGLPRQLGEFLNAVVARERGLRTRILSWDFSMLLAPSRELMPLYKLDWKTHRRLRFRMDGEHPFGGCHHQKVVVIDEKLGFTGGLDLALGRWDTDAHRPREPLRRLADGSDARPYHDVQAAFDGDAAVALAEVFRERWRIATGERLAPRRGPDDPWPEHLQPDLHDVDVALARTCPAFADRDEVREVEQLYLDTIASAERLVYIENQYLTNATVVDALIERLGEAHGPEVIIVTPLKTDGWMSQNTMDVMRAEQVARLREADRHERLGVYHPYAPELVDGPINVHAKVMVVDDHFVRVGSSNISNRSMALDTECDVAVEVEPGSDNAKAIAAFRRRLLAAHLGTDHAAVGAAEHDARSCLAALREWSDTRRTLRPLQAAACPDSELSIPDPRIADPEAPLAPERLLAHFVPRRTGAAMEPNLWSWGVLVTSMLALAGLWHWSTLGEWLDADNLAAHLAALRGLPELPLLMLAVFVAGGLLMLPLTVLVTASVLALGPWKGFGYSLAGALVSAALTYALGASLGRDTIRRLAGRRLNDISRNLARRGVLTVSVIRLVPVAPFTLVNLVAGASHLRFRDYLLGTVVGMTPGMLGVVALVDSTVRLMAEPSALGASGLAAAIAVVALASYGLVRWTRSQTDASGGPT